MSSGGDVCIPDEALEALAIRLKERTAQPGPAEEGPPDRFPADLFLPEETRVREHLETCRHCRKRLLEQLYSRHRYTEGLNHPLSEARFREMVREAVVEDRADEDEADGELIHEDGAALTIETRLYLDAPVQDEEEPALAAASRSENEGAARHCSRDGGMILRRYPGTASAPARLQLLADDPRLVAGAEVVIGGKTYRADTNGVLAEEDALAAATEAAIITVRSFLN